MKQIRKFGFETNSSSSHSISIDPTSNLLDTLYPDSEGFIRVYTDSYGWDWNAYNDPRNKASYLLTYARNDEIKKAVLKKVIQEHTGCVNVELVIDESDYIDHESTGVAEPAFQSENTLKQTIFNPLSYIYTGNDNDSPPRYFYDKPNEAYVVEIIVEGLEPYKVTHQDFEEKPLEEILDYLIQETDERNNGYHKPYDQDFIDKDGKEFKFDFVDKDKKILTLVKTNWQKTAEGSRKQFLEGYKQLSIELRKL